MAKEKNQNPAAVQYGRVARLMGVCILEPETGGEKNCRMLTFAVTEAALPTNSNFPSSVNQSAHWLLLTTCMELGKSHNRKF